MELEKDKNEWKNNTILTLRSRLVEKIPESQRKEIGVDELQNYYPYKYKLKSD